MLDEQSGPCKTGSFKRKASNNTTQQPAGWKTSARTEKDFGPGSIGGASRFFLNVKQDKDNECENVSDAKKTLFQLKKLADFVQRLAATQHMDLKKEELLAFLDCIGNSKGSIQIQSLVSRVVSLDSTDTTEIITTLWKLYGFVLLAIEENIKLVSLEKGNDRELATRFLYCAKASKSERNKGLENEPDRMLARSGGAQAAAERGEEYDNGDSSFNKTILTKNNHPTCKPIRLMEYLVRLITPPGGICLDPFLGSGTTGVACKNLGFNFIGIEMNKEYCEIAEKRIANFNSKQLALIDE